MAGLQAQRQAGRAMWQTGKPRCQAWVAGWQAQVAGWQAQRQAGKAMWQTGKPRCQAWRLEEPAGPGGSLTGSPGKAGRLGARLAGPCWQAKGLAGRPSWQDWPFRGPSGSGAVNSTVLALPYTVEHPKMSLVRYDRR